MLLSPGLLLQTAQAYLSISTGHLNAKPAVPLISVSLMPVYDNVTGAVEALNGSIILHAPNILVNQSLVELPLSFGDVPSQGYNSSNPLSAIDDLGTINLRYEDDADSNFRRWLPGRAVTGNVQLFFTALPRHVDIHTPIGLSLIHI